MVFFAIYLHNGASLVTKTPLSEMMKFLSPNFSIAKKFETGALREADS